MKLIAKVAVALLCVFAGGPLIGGPAASSTNVSLTAMTYNIGSAAGIPLGPEQMTQIAHEIKDAQADVVGMTEVDVGTYRHNYRDMVSEIAAALDSIGYPMDRYDTPITFVGGGSMVMVIWSRHPIVDSGYRITTEQGGEIRKVARARIIIDYHVAVECFMTHYYIGDGSFHQEQTDAVLDYVHSLSGPRVLMGDFNFLPESSYYNQIVLSGLDDACIAAGVGHLPTVGESCCVVAPLPLYQIDFIFGSQEIAWQDAYVPDTTVSDHWPLVASGLIALPPPMVATTPPGLLKAGWNLISLPLEPTDPDPAQVFKDDQGQPMNISGNLVRYEADSHSYRTYYEADPALFGELKAGEGYWLHLSAPTVLSYSGYPSIALRYDLAARGWRLIGCPSGSDIPLDLVLVRRQGEPNTPPIDLGVGIFVRHWLNGALYWYDPAAGGYATCGYYPWYSSHALEPWQGYWLHTNVDQLTLMFPAL